MQLHLLPLTTILNVQEVLKLMTHTTFASEQQRTGKDKEPRRGQDSEVAVRQNRYQV